MSIYWGTSFRDRLEAIVRDEMQKVQQKNFDKAVDEFIMNLAKRIEELIQDEIYFSRRYIRR